jgi:hypothetical protein
MAYMVNAHKRSNLSFQALRELEIEVPAPFDNLDRIDRP